jgi:hypothetical protein
LLLSGRSHHAPDIKEKGLFELSTQTKLVQFWMGVLLIVSMQAGELYSLTVPLCGFVGFIIGGLWAERVRKTIGLSTFFGRLIGMRELKDNDKRH